MKVIKFAASWCGPCKMLSKVLEDYTGDVQIEEVDIDANQQMAINFGVRGVPTCVLVNDEGGEVARKVGMMNIKEFEEFVKG